MQLAEAFIKAGELPDALDALNDHLQQHPADDTAHHLRAQVRLRLGTPEQLRAALDDLDAMTQPDHYLRSVVYERLNQPDDALQAAITAQETLTDEREKSRALERRLDLMRKGGQIEAALALALENDWVQWAADAAADLHDDTHAVTYYDQSLARIEALFGKTTDDIAANIRARILLKRGGAHHRLGNLDAADADYAAAAEVIPDDPVIAFNRGLVAAERGDMRAAQSQVISALATAPVALRARMRQELRSAPKYAKLVSVLEFGDE
jgi:tetratricopeptide (TPR) repeat protein